MCKGRRRTGPEYYGIIRKGIGMKKKLIGCLLAGLLVSATLAWQSGMAVQAGQEIDYSEEEYIEYEADGGFAPADEETELVYASAAELIPPVELHWEGPGKVAFRPVSTEAMTYHTEVYKDGKLVGALGSATVHKNIDDDGFYRSNTATMFFEGSGVYTLKVYVGTSSDRVYAEEAVDIEWTMPEERVATPRNLRWEKRSDEKFAVAVCDTVEHAAKYNFILYEDDEKKTSATASKNEYNASAKIEDMTAHAYTFTVRVSSEDLTQFANSKVTTRSDVLGQEKTEPTPAPEPSPEPTPEPTPEPVNNTFAEENAVKGLMIDAQHILKVETNEKGEYTSAKILKTDGKVDEEFDSYIANIVKKYDADGKPEEFYSLVFTDGQWDTAYDSATKGAYAFNGDSYFVAGGVVNQNANGLIYTGEAGWKFLAAGRVVTKNAGLVMYADQWFWIDDTGSCDDSYAAIVKWNGADFLVHGGRLRVDYTGFANDPKNESVWYHIEKGQVWGDGEITDKSIEGGEITRNVVNGVVQ